MESAIHYPAQEMLSKLDIAFEYPWSPALPQIRSAYLQPSAVALEQIRKNQEAAKLVRETGLI
jgi:hypothetical protein